MRPFFVYVLRCADGSFYTGNTDDLELRLAAHQAGTYGGYTSERLPLTLAYVCECPTRADAFAREWQIKGWSHAKKQALIDGDWTRVKELAKRGHRLSTGL